MRWRVHQENLSAVQYLRTVNLSSFFRKELFVSSGKDTAIRTFYFPKDGGLTGISLLILYPLHDLLTWYKIRHTETQVARWDFQNKGVPRWTCTSCFDLRSHCATCVPEWLILYHVAGSSCKGLIGVSFGIPSHNY